MTNIIVGKLKHQAAIVVEPNHSLDWWVLLVKISWNWNVHFLGQLQQLHCNSKHQLVSIHIAIKSNTNLECAEVPAFVAPHPRSPSAREVSGDEASPS